jgi:hypothetical protein
VSGSDPKLPAVTSAPIKNCGGCRSFRRDATMIGRGVCVWGPPLVVPVMAGSVPSIMSARPPVSASDSCDQWTERTDAN